MRKFCFPAVLFLSFIFISPLTAQDKVPIKFGKISLQDFDVNYKSIDSTADAVVVADIGHSEFEGNTKGWFSIKFERKTRVKIINRNGLDAANVEIPLYTDGRSEEKVSGIKAYTYNIENGKVTETKLENSSIFKDKISDHWVVQKFTMPAAKDGSIIEFSYTITSDFISNLQPWEFQGKYPRLWSEYEVEIPEFFRYVFLTQGAKNFFVKNTEETFGTWSVVLGSNSVDASRFVTINGKIQDNRWVMKDLGPLKEESYTSTIDNYIAKIQFQLATIQFPNSLPENHMNTWEKAAEELMKNERFGEGLSHANNWLDDDMKTVTAGAKTNLEKAKAIFNFVQKNFTNSEGNGIYTYNNLKAVYKAKNGNVAGINLLLTAMLRHENIEAKPVILSTKRHGLTNEFYPILERFNYVVCVADIDGGSYYLDAADPNLGFGIMHWKCYNGHARVIGKESATPVYFDADSLRETHMANIIISNDDKGKWSGGYSKTLGTYGSVTVKESVKEKGMEDYFKKIKQAYPAEITLDNTSIDSLASGTAPVTIHYDLDFKTVGEEDIIYFNPLLGDQYKENPFKSAVRTYPVEMPYTVDDIFVANIEIPKGYEVDEVPQSVRVNLNETEGKFEYLISKDAEAIQFRCRIKLEKAFFQPEDYDTLRQFFDFIVKKEAEQIVFKRKK